jgi:hypothetical protein
VNRKDAAKNLQFIEAENWCGSGMIEVIQPKKTKSAFKNPYFINRSAGEEKKPEGHHILNTEVAK